MSDFLTRHWNEPEVRADVEMLEAERASDKFQAGPPSRKNDVAGVVGYVHWLMDRDRKSTGLKSLQGKIWEEGYQAGDLKGEVYPDVLPALERWHRQGIDIAIFSSGSVQAQQSLFRSTEIGDLTRFIRAYFDTTTGPKNAPQSYERIAQALDHSPAQVLFVSDIVAELDAAKSAGMQTALSARTSVPTAPSGRHRIVHRFDQLAE